MYFDRNININKDDKFLDRDYCVLNEESYFRLTLGANLISQLYFNQS